MPERWKWTLSRRPESNLCTNVIVPVSASATLGSESARLARQASEPRSSPAKRAEHFSAQLAVVAAQIAEAKRERADPLAHGHFGDDSLDQMQREIEHAPAQAARTEAAALAAPRDESLEAALVARKPEAPNSSRSQRKYSSSISRTTKRGRPPACSSMLVKRRPVEPRRMGATPARGTR
jgi:hypothetical protein